MPNEAIQILVAMLMTSQPSGIKMKPASTPHLQGAEAFVHKAVADHRAQHRANRRLRYTGYPTRRRIRADAEQPFGKDDHDDVAIADLADGLDQRKYGHVLHCWKI